MTDEGNITITVIDRHGEAHELEAPTDMNMNVMEVCKAYELPVKGTCGGMALCSTCHCYVISDTELPEMGEDEEDMLDQAFFVEDNSRLGCQLRITSDLDGLRVQLAPEAEE
ncbi:2Fe-2S iron-sulfur cluster-binding protein [Lewinella sp. JB7]|uniref:2Fe-2S iron-sulfur cluster-binding protein n=1 Tax=Lewinella sp. JB7 TaxID=2962887 RepID=UPI0020C9BCFF|nr:2Fe-2S iron-sulfur cluster-binding protein [Lewinella sp. JB7]MCP9235349.1 2Fe-2S iron-sulfur cluster-binding protein [Lewinella sp. JB7]